MPNIVETAVAAGTFGTLVSAVQEAGLVETLSGPGPFTVFAPTEAAFNAIPEDTRKTIHADKAKLTALLTYHVLAGKYEAKDLDGQNVATTVQGEDLEITHDDGTKIDGAHIVTADIQTDNGVIHVIDTVLVPEALAGVLQA
jgi:uncharacterized surface protein with fasciclin (FAS1) repeats